MRENIGGWMREEESKKSAKEPQILQRGWEDEGEKCWNADKCRKGNNKELFKLNVWGWQVEDQREAK